MTFCTLRTSMSSSPRHRRFDGVAARLRGRLDRGVEGHARGAAGVGALIALQHRRRLELALAGEARVGRKQEAFAAGRRQDMRELRGAPFDRAAPRRVRQRNSARGDRRRTSPSSGNGLRRVEHDLEGRQPIGFLLEGELAAGNVLSAALPLRSLPRRLLPLRLFCASGFFAFFGASGSNRAE